MIRTIRAIFLVLSFSLLATACYSAGGEDDGPTASIVTLDDDGNAVDAPVSDEQAADDPAAAPTPEQIELSDEPLPIPEAPTVQTDLSDASFVVAAVGDESFTAGEFEQMADDWSPLWETRQGSAVRNEAGDLEAGFGAFVVSQWVQSQIYLDLAADRGIEPDDEDRDAATQTMVEQLPELAVESSAGQLFLAVQAVIASTTPTDEERILYYEENLETFPVSLCSAHILVETEAEADVAFERATTGGEDFAELAMELSTGPSGPGGGDLGCTDPAGFVPEFSGEALTATEPDEVVGPVQTEFGWHVILVRSTGVPPVEELTDQIDNALTAELSAEFQSMVGTAVVEIDPGLGTWDPTQGQVVPAF